MAFFMGIDIGSLNGKGVILDDNEVVASYITLSGINYHDAAEKIREALLKIAGISSKDISGTVATGFGADNVAYADSKVGDMICTARGINFIFPAVRMVIDVAAQSSKVMHVDEHGLLANFTVSEKCASGSGRFIEVIANVLRVDLKDFGALSLKSQKPVVFSTGCAVFGESEAITRVAEGVAMEDIAAGVNNALAKKITSMVKKINLEEPCAVCGGGSLNSGLVRAIENELKVKLHVAAQPQIISALGAAIIARERMHPMGI